MDRCTPAAPRRTYGEAVIGPPGSPLQAGARRYLARRRERALVHADPRGGPDSARTPPFWMLVGAAVAALLSAGALVLSVLRPPAHLGDAPIVLDRDTGALYVRIDAVLHPALNLTSARLAAGRAEHPRAVAPAAIDAAGRGPLVGIPGAPERIGAPLTESESSWTVCDGAQTTVLAGVVPQDGTAVLTGAAAILVRGPSGTTHLLYDGKRAALDDQDPAVVRALRLEGVTPTPVSAALLGAVPEVAPLTVPRVPDLGNPGPEGLPGTMVGDVIRIERADDTEHFVVLTGGLQRIGAVAADLIRFGGVGRDMADVAPAAVRAVPTLGALAVSTYPDRVDLPRRDYAAVVCATWLPEQPVTLRAGTAAGPGGVRLAQADGTGPAVDEVVLPPGRSLYVRPERGPRSAVVVTETGVRFAVEDTDTAGLLGLPAAALPAPWQLVTALPAGPTLSRAAALVAYDVVTAATPTGQR